jgi:hypothetical protein
MDHKIWMKKNIKMDVKIVNERKILKWNLKIYIREQY